jgi:hypothetical protein
LPVEITDVAKDGFDEIDVTDATLQVDAAQGLAILDASLAVTVLGGSEKLIVDTTANIAALTEGQVAGLEAGGFIIGSGVTVGSDGSVTVDVELSGGGTVTGAVTIDPTRLVSVDSGTRDFASGSVANNNQIIVEGATLDVGVALSGTGTVSRRAQPWVTDDQIATARGILAARTQS